MPHLTRIKYDPRVRALDGSVLLPPGQWVSALRIMAETEAD
jgi:hypothetical protein